MKTFNAIMFALIIVLTMLHFVESQEAKPHNTLTIDVYTDRTEFYDNGQLYIIAFDSCPNGRVWYNWQLFIITKYVDSQNGHNCIVPFQEYANIGNIHDGYIPMIGEQ